MSTFQMTGIFGVCQHLTMCRTGESVFHVSAIMGLERSWKDITGVRYVHDDLRCYLKLDWEECPQPFLRVACKCESWKWNECLCMPVDRVFEVFSVELVKSCVVISNELIAN